MILCRFGLHKWTIWSSPTDKVLVNVMSGRETAYSVQTRKCRRCNRFAWRYE